MEASSFIYMNFISHMTDFYIMKNFDQWNEVKKKIDGEARAPVKTGEIYWCRLGLNVGVEQDGKGDESQRPILVIKKYSHQIVLGIPLTTKFHRGDWYFDLKFKGEKMQVILNQSRPIDTKRLLSSMGQISERELSKIIDAYCKLIRS